MVPAKKTENNPFCACIRLHFRESKISAYELNNWSRMYMVKVTINGQQLLSKGLFDDSV